jgi:hypothetical protein
MHPFTGPWRIVKSLPGASYGIELSLNPSQKDKKHASDLSPYPPELIRFQPLNGADSCYSQLYKSFGSAPYKEAVSTVSSHCNLLWYLLHFAPQGDFKDLHFPTLSELNDKFDPFPWMDNDECITLLKPDAVEADTITYNGLPPGHHLPAVIYAFFGKKKQSSLFFGWNIAHLKILPKAR